MSAYAEDELRLWLARQKATSNLIDPPFVSRSRIERVADTFERLVSDRDTLRAQLDQARAMILTIEAAIPGNTYSNERTALDAVVDLRAQLEAVEKERDELRALSESRRRLYDSAAEERELLRAKVEAVLCVAAEMDEHAREPHPLTWEALDGYAAKLRRVCKP